MNEINDFTKLILNELERNRTSVENLKINLDKKFDDLQREIVKIQTAEKDLHELKLWYKEVTDTWSAKQMKEAKDEIYEQKNKWSKAIGLLIAIEIIVGFLISWILKKF
jgi:predicted  nucleic acid-binding Zn-ribbon protein